MLPGVCDAWRIWLREKGHKFLSKASKNMPSEQWSGSSWTAKDWSRQSWDNTFRSWGSSWGESWSGHDWKADQPRAQPVGNHSTSPSTPSLVSELVGAPAQVKTTASSLQQPGSQPQKKMSLSNMVLADEVLESLNAEEFQKLTRILSEKEHRQLDYYDTVVALAQREETLEKLAARMAKRQRHA